VVWREGQNFQYIQAELIGKDKEEVFGWGKFFFVFGASVVTGRL
jgi:hypothetical protein